MNPPIERHASRRVGTSETGEKDMMTKLTVKQLWEAMTQDERNDACLCALVPGDGVSPRICAQILEALAEKMHFRLATLQKKRPEENAVFLRRWIGSRELSVFWDDLIRAWLLQRHRPMIQKFLDATGIQHNQALVTEESPEPSCGSLVGGLRAAESERRPREFAIYIGYLLLFGDEFWAQLAQAVDTSGLDLAACLASVPEGIATRPEPTAPPEDAPPLPEESEDFTTLDHLLIRTAVASVFGVAGSLRPEQLEDLVDEVVELNGERLITLFHRGFLHSLLNKELVFHFPGENEARRAWYLTGSLMGMLRRDATGECLKVIREQRELMKTIIENRHLRCGQMLLPHLWMVLWDAEEFGLLRQWIDNHVDLLNPGKRENLLLQLQFNAAAMLRRDRWTEATIFLDLIDADLARGRELEPKFVAFLKPRNDRKRAQALQLQGHFAPAMAILEPLARREGFPDASNAMSDLALARAGFRSITAILPRKSEESSHAIRDGLAKVEPLLQEAVASHGVHATNAHFCLGVLKCLSGPSASNWAADHFKASLVGMVLNQESYEEGGLLPWAQFLLGLALLENADPGQYQNACERVDLALGSQTPFPVWLWRRALEAAMMFDDVSLAQRIGEHILKQPGDEAVPVLWQSGIAKRKPAMRAICLDWLLSKPHPTREMWDRLREMLDAAMRGGDYGQAGDILDALEGIAAEDSNYRQGFIALLNEEKNYSPAWTRPDVENSLLRFLELEGRHAEAAAHLRNRFFQTQSSGAPGSETDARAIIERIQEYRLPDFDTGPLERLLAPEPVREVIAATGAVMPPAVSVLYVGGDETQRAYEEQIRSELQHENPWIAVQFYFPGWSSRWNVHLEKVRGIVPQVHAVVLNTLVRTQFGRHVRAACDSNIPWFPCTGRGKASLKRSIIRAAEWAAAASQPG